MFCWLMPNSKYSMVKNYFVLSHIIVEIMFLNVVSFQPPGELRNQLTTSLYVVLIFEMFLYLKIIIVWLAVFLGKRIVFITGFKNFLSYLWIFHAILLTFLPKAFFFSTQLFQIMFTIMFFFPLNSILYPSAHSEQCFQILGILRSKRPCILLLCFHWIDFFILFSDNLLLKSSFWATQAITIAYFSSAIGRRLRNITSRLQLVIAILCCWNVCTF